jgi:hypothetical protein
MKKANVVTLNEPKSNFSGKSSRCVLGALTAIASLPLAGATSYADDAPPPSKVHALVSFEFANEYVTPRGMIVRDQGLTVQPLFLGFVSLYSGDSFINSVTLIPGVWNDLGTATVAGNTGQSPSHWTEIDPIAGIEIGFAKHFTLDVTYTEFVEQILNIGTSQHLDTKLSFDDSSYFKGFGFHPYLEFWQELHGKATDADLPYIINPLGKPSPGTAPGSSYYFELGIDPTYTFNKLGSLKLEMPIDVQLPDSKFYGTYYKSASTVSLFDIGLKGTLPMNFMPQGYGHWSWFAGFKYMYFVDDNLYNLNTYNAPGKPTRDTFQVFTGVSIFF